MALPQGLNFRDTLAFKTDGANEIFVGPATVYPVSTAAGNIGWETSITGVSTRDDDVSFERRLAGCHFIDADITKDFRIDLPAAGDYLIRIAAGRATFSVATKVELFDGTTSLGVIATGSTGAAGSYRDATNAILTAANWPGSNAAVTKTFATTICRFRIGQAAVNNMIAHIYIESAVTTTPKTATLTDSLSGGELV